MSQLKSYAKQLGVLDKNLYFENQVSKEKIKKYFLAADMCSSFVLNVKETWAEFLLISFLTH